MIEVDVKNRFELGDTLELMTPQGNRLFKLEQMENRKGQTVDAAPGNGHFVRIPLPAGEDLEYGLLMRNLPNAPQR
jgi:putative protease